ncbi:MAG: hypothetical protein EA408_05545 [Marinilabiliales bacterium]|nr:MAG: hypothetical protein EA408_05545 [Marinilabiliales bacterium]
MVDTADTAVNFFPAFSGIFGGRFFHLRKDSFLAEKKYDKKLCVVDINLKVNTRLASSVEKYKLNNKDNLWGKSINIIY